MKATYNITTDKIKAWFDERLSKEDYQRMRRSGFIFCHGQKCFMGKWSTGAEDLVKELGITEIEADDQPDDVETRVERFSGYAESAQKSAESSEAYLAERANTERRRENAINSIEKNLSAAEHWQRRIEGAIRNAAYKERPDVIARRIEGLEKDRRSRVASFTPDSRVDGARYGAPGCAWVGPKGRGGHWVKLEQLPAIEAHAKRWIEHIDKRLQYERALLEAAGGIVGGTGAAPVDHEKFQVGGAIKTGREDWRIITKVNKRTVEVFTPRCHWRNYWKVDRTEIVDFAIAEQVNSAPENSELWHALRGYRNKLEAQRQLAKLEKDHMDALDEMSKPRKYSQLGEYDREQVRTRLVQSLKAQEVAA